MDDPTAGTTAGADAQGGIMVGFGFIFLALVLIHLYTTKAQGLHPAMDSRPEDATYLQILALAIAVALAIGLAQVLPGILQELAALHLGERHLNSFKAPDISIPGAVAH